MIPFILAIETVKIQGNRYHKDLPGGSYRVKVEKPVILLCLYSREICNWSKELPNLAIVVNSIHSTRIHLRELELYFS
jgi:hypothetical protein